MADNEWKNINTGDIKTPFDQIHPPTRMKTRHNVDSASRASSDEQPTQTTNSPTCARAYAQSLRPWLHYNQYVQYSQYMNSMWPMQMMSCFPPGTLPRGINTPSTANTTQSQTIPRTVNIGPNLQNGAVPLPQANNDLRRNIQHAHIHGGLYSIPPIWKRLAAELIDFFILFYIKLMVTILLLKEMGFNLSDHSDSLLGANLFTVDGIDYEKALSLTSEIIALEVMNRICLTIVETLCLRQGMGVTGGATPGKLALGLRVVSCQHVIQQDNGQVLVIPAQNIGYVSAFVRSIIKNFTIAFFLPICFTVFMFKHNRAAYDVIAGTIVVQPANLQEQR